MNKVTFKEAIDKDLGEGLLLYLNLKFNKLAGLILGLTGLCIFTFAYFYMLAYNFSLVYAIGFIFICSFICIAMGLIFMISQNIDTNKKLREVINGSKGN